MYEYGVFLLLFILAIAVWAARERVPYRHTIRIPIYRPVDDC
jgi:hypothetical protein